jgi:uncharacterized protein (TIGR00255 family)
MTGFGQSSGTNERHRVAVTLRSVNSRYLDLSLKLREEYRALEPAVRSAIGKEIGRGRVDATLEIRPLHPLAAEVEIQSAVVLALHRACHEMAEKGLIAAELSVGDLLAMPEVVEVRVESDTLDGGDESLLLDQLGLALAQLVQGRETEGQQLRGILEQRLGELSDVARRLRELAQGVRVRQQERLASRLAALLEDLAIDEGRLAQEAAILVDRGDVMEELDRLEAHLSHFREVLEGREAAGKRLDFLSQEIQRELNTLGSKARDAELTRAVLDGKVLCEQIREQVQNVE